MKRGEMIDWDLARQSLPYKNHRGLRRNMRTPGFISVMQPVQTFLSP